MQRNNLMLNTIPATYDTIGKIQPVNDVLTIELGRRDDPVSGTINDYDIKLALILSKE